MNYQAWERSFNMKDDENHGQYCENCHIATGDCECPKDSCDICEDARDEDKQQDIAEAEATGN